MFVSFLEIYLDDIYDLGRSYLNKRSGTTISGVRDFPSHYSPPKQLVKDIRPASPEPRSALSGRVPATVFETSSPKLQRSKSLIFPKDKRLKERREKIEIHENPDGSVYVKNMAVIPVTCMSDAMKIVNSGVAERATYETQMNKYSSRSHTIFSLTVVQKDRAKEMGETISGVLNLVDLAGSERLKRSESEGMRMREAVVINKSLSALGNVILGLDSKAEYIRYRDSKLTRILQDSLGGNSYTTVLATIYPVSENYEECLATLQFAFRCRNVQNRPHINYLDSGEDQQGRRIAKLQDEIAKLKQELADTHRHYQEKLQSGGKLKTGESLKYLTSSDDPSAGSVQHLSVKKMEERLKQERESLREKLEKKMEGFRMVREQSKEERERNARERGKQRAQISILSKELDRHRKDFEEKMQDSTTFHQKQIQQVIDYHKTLMEEQFKWVEGMPQLIHEATSDLEKHRSAIRTELDKKMSQFQMSLRKQDEAQQSVLGDLRSMYESWLQNIKEEYDSLRAEFEQMDQEFCEHIEETGMYRRESLEYIRLLHELVRELNVRANHAVYLDVEGGLRFYDPGHDEAPFDVEQLHRCIREARETNAKLKRKIAPRRPASAIRTSRSVEGEVQKKATRPMSAQPRLRGTDPMMMESSLRMDVRSGVQSTSESSDSRILELEAENARLRKLIEEERRRHKDTRIALESHRRMADGVSTSHRPPLGRRPTSARSSERGSMY
eukprot:TRINITY_DN3081_c0_g1_i1.p1 TRINITY_DN3081_c0_g1~~TRINITY_DN3081_c0_g1_i1.p1  ORF type:complete len:729 (-),score=207.24 TRINITY_DN3081_c0_g1_i1:135-2321(-)